MKAISTRFPSYRQRFDRQARIRVAWVALVWGTAASAFPFTPVAGEWRGTGAPARPYNFTVKSGGTALTSLLVSWTMCGGSSTTLDGDIPISADNKFSASASYFGCVSLTTSGTFTSPTTASGSLSVTYVKVPNQCDCSGTENLTWTATKVPPQADLSVTVNDGKATIVAGTTNVYTMIVTNNGPEPLTSLTLTDALPADLLSPVFAPSSGTYDPATGAWTSLSLDSGQAVALTLTATVKPSKSGNLLNTVTVSPPAGVQDSYPNNNQSTDASTVVAEADLVLTKTGPGLLTPPTGVTWRITVANNGPSDASLVQVADTAPTGLTFVSTSGACATAFPCTLATVPAGQTRTIDAAFRVPADYAGPNPISNTATVATSTVDPNPGNESATAASQVVPPGPASSYFTVEPCRLLDTRDDPGDYGGPSLVAGQDRTFIAFGRCGIPATARAVSVNLTVTGATVQGNLRLYPGGQPLPLVSTVNYVPGLTRANNAVVALDGTGQFTIRCGQTSGTAHAIVDVNGYFE